MCEPVYGEPDIRALSRARSSAMFATVNVVELPHVIPLPAD
jgi:hypothetical protein